MRLLLSSSSLCSGPRRFLFSLIYLYVYMCRGRRLFNVVHDFYTKKNHTKKDYNSYDTQDTLMIHNDIQILQILLGGIKLEIICVKKVGLQHFVGHYFAVRTGRRRLDVQALVSRYEQKTREDISWTTRNRQEFVSCGVFHENSL